MSRRPFSPRVAVAAALGGALVVGLVAPASAAPVSSGVVTRLAASTATTKVTASPSSLSVVKGKTATFKVTATGSHLTYQWYVRKAGTTSYVKIAGATKSSYSVVTTASLDGARYKAHAIGSGGTVASASAALVVISEPKIVHGVKSPTVAYGEKATFTVTATGHHLKYEWRVMLPSGREWKTVSHAAEYTVTGTEVRNGLGVRVVVSNEAGATSSRSDFGLRVLSSPEHPHAMGNTRATIDYLSYWTIGRVDYANLDADPSAPEGWTYVTTSIIATGDYGGCHVPSELAIGVRSTDGTIYPALVPDLQPYSNCDDPDADPDNPAWEFTVKALVPESALAGATWRIVAPTGTHQSPGMGYWPVQAA